MSSHLRTDRRSLLALAGGGAAAALLPATASDAAVLHKHGHLPVKAIEDIVGIEGTVDKRVLSLDVGRDDIGDSNGPQGVTFSSAFELNGTVTFQPLGNHRAFCNGDLALKASELNPVIDALQANGLVFQAMHQHYFGLDPMVWFIHFRGTGAPRALAAAVRKVIDVTATPLPQKPPSKPTTPLDHAALAKILHGSSEIGDEGVVTVSVERTDRIVIDGVHVDPGANISTEVQFKPLDDSGARVAAGPDFALRGTEAQRVCRIMRAQSFEIGCLYNQETQEHPQLFFAHMLATGEPLTLARQIRRGLDATRSA
jgi:hypothetical protein